MPATVLFDEPSLGLSPVLTKFVREFDFQTHRKEKGIASMLVEQNMRAALRIADRAYVLRVGRIVRARSASESRARRISRKPIWASDETTNKDMKPCQPPTNCRTEAATAMSTSMGRMTGFPPRRKGRFLPTQPNPVESLFAMVGSIGVSRGVIVHALAAGPDNEVTLDASSLSGQAAGRRRTAT